MRYWKRSTCSAPAAASATSSWSCRRSAIAASSNAWPQGRVKPALALSLHSSDAVLRARLLPRAPAIAPDELVALGDAYARATGYPMQVQWTLLDGVNDSAAEIEGIVRLLVGRFVVLNLIPYNSVDGLALARPAAERSRALASELQRRGVLTKLRQSAGQDVQAGCGQLRARHERPAHRIGIVPMQALRNAALGDASRRSG